MTDAQQEELASLLERVDELSISDGVDSEEYERAMEAYKSRCMEYSATDHIEE